MAPSFVPEVLGYVIQKLKNRKTNTLHNKSSLRLLTSISGIIQS